MDNPYSNVGTVGLWWQNLTGYSYQQNAAEGVAAVGDAAAAVADEWPTFNSTLQADPYTNTDWLALYGQNLIDYSYLDNAREGVAAMGDAASAAGSAIASGANSITSAAGSVWSSLTAPFRGLAGLSGVLVIVALVALVLYLRKD